MSRPAIAASAFMLLCLRLGRWRPVRASISPGNGRNPAIGWVGTTRLRSRLTVLLAHLSARTQAEGLAPPRTPAGSIQEVRFTRDSPLEARFELSVPPAGADLFEVNGTKITGVRERSSRFREG
jgi:hypothetical protein